MLALASGYVLSGVYTTPPTPNAVQYPVPTTLNASNGAYILNVSLYDGTGFSANATINFTLVNRGALYVNISLPLNDSSKTANTTFTLTANVTCQNADCGTVEGLARYNSSGNLANATISTTQGDTPLFINGSGGSGTVDSLQYKRPVNLTWASSTTMPISLLESSAAVRILRFPVHLMICPSFKRRSRSRG